MATPILKMKSELAMLEDVLQPTQRVRLEDGLVFAVCDIDVSKAEYVLGRLHTKQRPLRQSHVKRIARELEARKYQTTGEPLHFDKAGMCINGQHRCQAVIASGVPIHNAIVMLGMEQDAILHLDNASLARTGVDTLKMSTGIAVPAAVFAAVVIEFCDFEVKQRSLLSRAEQAEVVRDCGYLSELTSLRGVGVASGMGTPSGVLGAALRCMRVDREQGYEFFAAALKNQHELGGAKLGVLQVLCTALYNAKGVSRGYESTKEVAARCIKAWNAHRNGSEVRQLRYSGSIPVAV